MVLVLIMSVYPGFGGQKFIEASLDKVKAVRNMANELQLNDLWIQVDGGIGEDNIALVMEAGANVFVAGSAVFKGDSAANVKVLNAILQ